MIFWYLKHQKEIFLFRKKCLSVHVRTFLKKEILAGGKVCRLNYHATIVKNFNFLCGKSTMGWKFFWNSILVKFERWCILKRNILGQKSTYWEEIILFCEYNEWQFVKNLASFLKTKCVKNWSLQKIIFKNK